MKVGIIGCGNMGRRRLEILRALQYGQIMVYDTERARAEYLAMQAHVAPTIEALWRWKPDAVLICTPPWTHLDYLWQAYGAGIRAVFIEKPLDVVLPSEPDLAQLEDCVTYVGANWRFSDGFRVLKDAIGLIHPTAAAFWLAYPLAKLHPDWRESYFARTGAILDVGSHLVDLALDWFGPATLDGCKVSKQDDLDVAARLNLRHAAGVTSTCVVDVTAEYDVAAMVVGKGSGVHWGYTQPPGPEMFVRETEHFLTCAREGRQTVNPVSNATATLRLLLEARG